MSEGANDVATQWVDVPVELPAEGETAVFSIGDLALILCQAEGAPYVLHDSCPHVRTSMAGARLRGTLIECPLHGGLMDVRDGAPAGMPIRRPGTCYAVREAETGLQVEIPA